MSLRRFSAASNMAYSADSTLLADRGRSQYGPRWRRRATLRRTLEFGGHGPRLCRNTVVSGDHRGSGPRTTAFVAGPSRSICHHSARQCHHRKFRRGQARFEATRGFPCFRRRLGLAPKRPGSSGAVGNRPDNAGRYCDRGNECTAQPGFRIGLDNSACPLSPGRAATPARLTPGRAWLNLNHYDDGSRHLHCL